MRSGNASQGRPAAAGAKTAARASAAGREAALAFNLANASFRGGDWAAALAHSERALAADPALTVAAVLRARCLASLGRLEDAQDAYRASLRMDEANFSAWLELGNVHRRLRAMDQALQCYARAVAARPQDVRGHLASARALEELKTPQGEQRAAVHYHRAVTIAEDDPKSLAEVHHTIGRSRLDIGDAPRALEALRQAAWAARGAPEKFSEDEVAGIATDLADALLVIHFNNDAIVGQSRVAGPVEEVAEGPPNPAQWAGRRSYYLIPLSDYREFPQAISMNDFIARNHSALLEELRSDAPKRHPFILYNEPVFPR